MLAVKKKFVRRRRRRRRKRTSTRPKLFQQHVNAHKIGIRKTSESQHFSSFYIFFFSSSSSSSFTRSFFGRDRTNDRKKEEKYLFCIGTFISLETKKKMKKKKNTTQ